MRRAAACAALWLLACATPRPPTPATAPAAPASAPGAPPPVSPDAPAASDPEPPAEVERPIRLSQPRELPVPVRTEVYVIALPIGQSRVRVWIDGGNKIEIHDDGSDGAALDALASAARAKLGADARAICAIDKSLPYGAAIGIIDAFKKAGFGRVSLAVQPSPAK